MLEYDDAWESFILEFLHSQPTDKLRDLSNKMTKLLYIDAFIC